MEEFYAWMPHSTMAAPYTIGDLAREFGITTRTIRYYETQGLLSPSRDGVNRVFSQRDRARLKLALRAIRLGFSLTEIRELFNLHDLARTERQQLEMFLARLDRQQALLEQQREDIEVMLNEIRFFATQCRRQLEVEKGQERRGYTMANPS
jgi:DNA-binding transcriptional MerR regulator